MKIIGEKINGTRKKVAAAIAARDVAAISDLAQKQAAAGAAWLDLNAGTHPDREGDDLIWLIETVQAVVDTPLCLDSANPAALQAAIKVVAKTPMINSISGEEARLAHILPIVAEHGCEVIALAMDGKQIPPTSAARIEVVHKIVTAARAHGVPDERLYVDPLAMTISTSSQSAVTAFETMQAVRRDYPTAHLTIGLSNISFGLPERSSINRYFLSLAIQNGLDSAILDPLDQDIQAAILTTELLLGRDHHCLNFLRATRKGIFSKPTA
jgi:5-methyltetrahydrofolate--homocysteine methyltransferase